MTSENSLTPITAVPPSTSPPEVVEYAAPAPANPLTVLHSLLRGRYPLAIALAILGLLVGVPAGYLITKPQYKSVGTIRYRPIIAKLIYSTEQNGVMPMFESFLASQVAEIQSRRVLLEAMHREEWKSIGRETLPEDEAEFAENLEVVNVRGAPLVLVSFTDRDPKAAAAAVRAVIAEYAANFDAKEGESESPSLARLQNLKQSLQAAHTLKLSTIRTIAGEVVPDSLHAMYEDELRILTEYKRQLSSVTMAVASSGTPDGPDPRTAPTTQGSPNYMDLAVARDARLQQLKSQLLAADDEASLQEPILGAEHPKVQQLRASAKVIEKRIADRTEQVRADAESPSSQSIQSDAAGNFIPTLDQMKNAQVRLQKLVASQSSVVQQLVGKLNEIEQLRNEDENIRSQLRDATERYDQLTIEGRNVKGRIDVISAGDIPFAPDKDRRKALAAVGGLGLAALGVGIVALIGFVDRRMHYIDAAKSRLKRVDRMLGVLPDLPEDLTDPQQASAAAYCVHRIRAMIQIRQRTTGYKVFAITSPSPGDGKTSLTITLGMSLASCGCRTLLVDCDMDGGGLTSRFGHAVRRPLGQILLDAGLLGEAKLQDAIDLARKKSIKLGEALVEMGCVSDETIQKTLIEQRRAMPGLTDVLGGEPVDRAIRATGYPGLHVLPLGCPPDSRGGRLAPVAMRRLLDQLSTSFDIVLVDCGPILGSIEAAVVSAEVDGVVLVVSRGSDRSAAEAAVNLLASAGAEVEGIVFNRAESSDVSTSGFSSSSTARSSGGFSDQVKERGFGHFDTASAMNSTSRESRPTAGAASQTLRQGE